MLKNKFFGRKNYLAILEKRIGGLKYGYRQNLAIIGDETIGKTSLVFELLNKFCDNHIVILYLDIKPESFNSFAKRFIGTLLYNFLSNSGIPMKEDLDFLLSKSRKFIPGAVEKIQYILTSLNKKKKNPALFMELLSLCDIIHRETGKFCVVIMDEFQNLESMGIKNLYPEWSKLLMVQKSTMYIIVSSMKFKSKAILSKNLSLLFGNFEVITVEPFDIKVSEEYLDYHLKTINLDQGFKNFIVHFTGGWPYYLEIISEALLKSEQNDLLDSLENLLFMPSGILNQRFSNYIKYLFDSCNNNDHISILYLIVSGHNKIKDTAHILGKTKNEIMLRIKFLLELDAINRSGDFLTIGDRVFGFWLKFVYQERLHSLTFDAKNQKTIFRENIQNLLQEFILSADRPIAERVKELLSLFEGEVVQIEKRRLRLSQFREIKALEFNRPNLRDGLIARSSDTLWIMAFKYDLLTEDDVTEFVKECKKYQRKLQRKIIIAFQDVDANARLRALEERILTWDIRNLNQIFDLFSKPRVIALKNI